MALARQVEARQRVKRTRDLVMDDMDDMDEIDLMDEMDTSENPSVHIVHFVHYVDPVHLFFPASEARGGMGSVW